MIVYALHFAFGCFGLAILFNLYRIARAPGVPDRVLALDTMAVNAVALVILLGMRWGTPLLFEAALIIAMLGFVSTVGLARFLSRGDVME